jgi:hypothetical protein
MFASWDEMIDAVAPRSGLWVGRPKYCLVRSFVCGFATGRDDDVLGNFQRWLSGQPQHYQMRNHAWWSLLLREVFDHGSEHDLVYPDQDKVAIAHMFSRLREFLASQEEERRSLTGDH